VPFAKRQKKPAASARIQNTMANHLNNGWKYYTRVDKNAEGWTVLEFYTQRYSHSSQDVWEKHIVEGRVQLNGQNTTPDIRVKVGHTLTYYRQPWVEPDAPRNIDILFEDDHILVVGKPAGLPVLPGGNFLDNTLLALLRNQFGKVDPIHRLGRGTTGLVLFARTDIARTKLSADMREGRFGKIYRALVSGTDVPDQFEITQPIGKIPYPKIHYLYAATPDGKASHTIGHVLHREHNRTLCHIDLITGRPHQIRIHLAAIGHPLVGEPLYAPSGIPRSIKDGEPIPFPGDCGYLLHAYQLHFSHPATERKITVISPPPDALQTPEEQIA
jgi:23S rRNA pseudouridine1911/1915/1917 synthase